jgi:hypothetical protein
MSIQNTSLWIVVAVSSAWSAPALASHAKAGVWKETVTSLVVIKGAPPDTKRVSSGLYCRTADEATRDSPPKVGRDCAQQNVKWTGNSVKGETVCGPPLRGTGKFSMTFTGNSHYVGGYVFDEAASGEGRFRMTTSFTADWVSADCGTVKPLQ